MTPTLKKFARPPVQLPHPDPDPLGFGQVLAEISTKLAETYQERLDVLLSKYLLVEFEPAELQSIVDAGTAQEWPPVALPATLTVDPRDASGFVQVLGALETPSEERQFGQASNAAEDGEYINTIFGEKIPLSQLKPARRSKGRRR
jgi:hypothetical protein